MRRCALALKRLQGGLFAPVQPHGLYVNGGYGHQVGPIFLIKIIQIRGVLKIVGVDVPTVYHEIGLYVVGELFDIQGDFFGRFLLFFRLP